MEEERDHHPLVRPRQHRESAESKKALLAYLDMGKSRSLRALLRNMQLGRGWDGHVPSFATLSNWSSWFGWQRIAEQHDNEVAATERRRIIREQAEEAAARRDERLRSARMLRGLMWDALMIEDEEEILRDENGAPIFNPETGQPLPLRRPTRYRELSSRDVRSVIELHKAAAETERLDYQIVEEEKAFQVKSVTKILGPEAIQHLKEQVVYLVQEIQADARERKKLIDMGLLEPEPVDERLLDGDWTVYDEDEE